MAIKSGEDEEGRARSIPSRDITVQHLTVHGGRVWSLHLIRSSFDYPPLFIRPCLSARPTGIEETLH